MDFESSISNEIGAELLTGKQLNLERARGLALNNDIAGASEEILRQVGGTAEFAHMNRIQQEAIAKAVGLSKDELSASLIEREALQKIGVKDAAAARAKFDAMVKEHGMAYAIKNLGDEQLAGQFQQQSIAERLNNSIEKLKELFIGIAEPVLGIVGPIVDLLLPAISAISWLLNPIIAAFTGISNIISAIFDPITSFKDVLKEMSPVAIGVATALSVAGIAITVKMLPGLIKSAIAATTLGIKTAYLAITSGKAAIGAITTQSAWTLGIGVAAIVAGIATGIAAMNGAFGSATPVNDAQIAPDGGLIVSGQKGTYSLDKNDHIIAGTELGKTNTQSNTQQPIAPNYDKHFDRMNELLSAIAAKDTNVYQDSTKISTANNIFSYKSLV